jgi:multidrug efflux system outer membrane protein
MRALILFLITFFIGSCAVKPEKVQKPSMALPEKTSNEKDYSKYKNWWKNFNDENLNKIVEKALKNNDNLLLAFERIKEAAAIYQLSSANLYPQINLTAQASRVKTSPKAPPFGLDLTYNNFQISPTFSYELDLFGALQNVKKADYQRLLSQKNYTDAVKLKLVADVVTVYIDICTANEKISQTQKLLKEANDIYKYRKRQYENGLINILPVKQEEANIKNLEYTLQNLKKGKRLLQNSLSILIGENPKEIFESSNLECSQLPEPLKIPPLLPSPVIENRPDIKQAENLLIASNYDLAAAKSRYFPTINLTSALGFQSRSLSTLINSSAVFWNIGTSMVLSLFDFGRIKSQIKIEESRKKQALITYAYTVKNAFFEINNELINLEEINKNLDIKNQEIQKYKEIYNISNSLYSNGLADYLNVLLAEKNYDYSTLDLIDLKGEYLKHEVYLYKSLGLY